MLIIFISKFYFDNLFLTMANTQFVKEIEKKFIKKDFPRVNIGDSIRVGIRIKDGNKERTQFFDGTVIGKKNKEYKACLTVRHVSQSVGVERILFLHSPAVVELKILRSFKARRAKLYYFRNRSNKNRRLKQRLSTN